MIFHLGCSGGTRVNGVFDALSLLAVAVHVDFLVCPDVFLSACVQRGTPSNTDRDAVGFTMRAGIYGSLRSRLLVPYAFGPCRGELDKTMTPT